MPNTPPREIFEALVENDKAGGFLFSPHIIGGNKIEIPGWSEASVLHVQGMFCFEEGEALGIARIVLPNVRYLDLMADLGRVKQGAALLTVRFIRSSLISGTPPILFGEYSLIETNQVVPERVTT